MRRIAARPLLAPRHWSTIVEAGAALVAASLATRWLSFDRFMRLASRPVTGQARTPSREVARIVDAIADRLPFRAVCLQRGLALHWMLRRRGVDALLHYGIQLQGEGEELAAHVWVSVAGEIILGAPQHELFTEVARFPIPHA
jgi:hypothetical protein